MDVEYDGQWLSSFRDDHQEVKPQALNSDGDTHAILLRVRLLHNIHTHRLPARIGASLS